MNKIILLPVGLPCCGKDYSSQVIIDYFKENKLKYPTEIGYLCTGDKCRDLVKNLGDDSELKQSVNKGLLIPDPLIINMVEEFLANDEHEIIVINGSPRSLFQFGAFYQLTKRDYDVFPLYLKVWRETLQHRMEKRQTEEARTDDDLANFEKKIEEGKLITMPAILEAQKLYGDDFFEIDAEVDCKPDIIKALDTIFRP